MNPSYNKTSPATSCGWGGFVSPSWGRTLSGPSAGGTVKISGRSNDEMWISPRNRGEGTHRRIHAQVIASAFEGLMGKT